MITPSVSTTSLKNFDCEAGLISPEDELVVYTLMVKGMTCAACSSCIESTLKSNLDGLKKISIDLDSKTVTLHCNKSLRIDEAVQLIDKAGFTVTGSSSDWRCRLEARKRADVQEQTEIKKKFFKILFFALPVILTPHQYKLLALIFSFPLHLYAAFDIYKSALIKCNMERLIAINCLASLLYSVILWEQHGLFDCAAYVLILYTGGKYLEIVLKRRINVTGDDLLITMPRTVKRNGINVAIRDLKVGHVIDLNPGDLIPFDGEIQEIRSALFLNESTLTGEPLPKQKYIDDQVLAGTRVENGMATMKITKSTENSFINKIARGVYEPMLTEDEGFNLIDEIAKWFIPVVLILSLCTFMTWYLIFWLSSAMPRDLIPEWRNTLKYPSTPLAASIYISLTVLCIACPCALAVATPVAVAISKSANLRKGVIIRDPRAFTTAPETDILLFDKTGTLTTGKPRISFKEFEGFESWMFEACKLIEGRLLEDMEHPIARSIYNYCKSKRVQYDNLVIDSVNFKPGQGIEARDNMGHEIKISKSQNPVDSSSQLFVNDMKVGEFTWFDELKPEALDVVNYFKLNLNYKLGLISGDSQYSTERTARHFLPGTFSYVFGDCKPEDKARIVSDLKSQGNRVTFVGDGLNDSVAMSQSDFSISLDASVTFPSANLIPATILRLPEIFSSARNLKRQINFNLIWASLYNLLAVPLAMGAAVPFGVKPIGPEIGTLLMMISGISIILSSIIFL